jgi:hypothetical protein
MRGVKLTLIRSEVNPNSKFTLRYHWKMGKHYGFPRCCIRWFILVNLLVKYTGWLICAEMDRDDVDRNRCFKCRAAEVNAPKLRYFRQEN